MAVSTNQRKSLLMVMMMSQRGKILSFYGAFALILDTFTWVSTFNNYDHKKYLNIFKKHGIYTFIWHSASYTFILHLRRF